MKTIKDMTIEEKLELCSGTIFSNMTSIPNYYIHTPVFASKFDKPTTIFPPASCLSSTWNLDLAYKVGQAIGHEAIKNGISVVNGPSANIKRNPLSIKNHENFSEDPVVSGLFAAAWINGVQDVNVGSCLQHFIINNQELNRINLNVIIDDKALHEIYLRPFQIALKHSTPLAITCSNNYVNSIHSSANYYLTTGILRNQFNFQGLVISPSLSIENRVESLVSGVDLEYPSYNGYFNQSVIDAINNQQLEQKYLDKSAQKVLDLIAFTKLEKPVVDETVYLKNRDLARKVACEGAVLLKNQEEILPLDKNQKVAVIGAFAKMTNQQPSFPELSLLEALDMQNITYDYAQGFLLEDKTDDALIKTALEIAKTSQKIIITIGYCNESKTMRLPKNQLSLLRQIYNYNRNIIVVLIGNNPLEFDFESDVKAILQLPLNGLAAVDLLYGDVNPSGKLTETYPIKYQDVVSTSKISNPVLYSESIFVGYRYFDKAVIDVKYPFGYGLSYTTFTYSNLNITSINTDVEVRFTITNTGKKAGANSVQVYVSNLSNEIMHCVKQLQGFTKVYLQPNEAKEVCIILDKTAFEYYDTIEKQWQVQSGHYLISVGHNVNDTPLTQDIKIFGVEVLKQAVPVWYVELNDKPTEQDFESLYNKDGFVFTTKTKHYSTNHCLNELRKSNLLTRIIVKWMSKKFLKELSINTKNQSQIDCFTLQEFYEVPINKLPMLSNTFSTHYISGVVNIANRHLITGIKELNSKN